MIPRRRALLVLTLAVAGVACAAAALPRAHAPTVRDDAGGLDAGEADGATASPVDAGLDVAALAERLAPGMREIERLAMRDAGTYSLAPTDVDRCYRIAIVAPEIVDATLTDDAGHVLGAARGKSTAVGTRGPVCLRKGQRATLAVQGAAASSVELIVWTSP